MQKLFTSFFCAFAALSPVSAHADTLKSFYQALGEPLVYAGFQTPPAFHEELSVLNRQRKVFVNPQDQDTFWDADVWGIFLATPEQVDLLPEQLRSAYQQIVGSDRKAPLYFARIHLETGEEKAIMFAFLARYGQPKDVAVCKAARSVYRFVQGELKSDVSKQDMLDCSQ
ncbi:hypothetical protein J7443_07020 [Tropicibacter sp. R15_0]|uniref:hypothetical protein n=1 Tax=Tropicibacter sp. R15_0 TaxID=2821101 RepID=UPI001AD9590E|nr:hypothetical protein [Tropicibacter sp. R15_0]MBO9464973.1 hypothetical protein [Tropicibacter sp. R15_0]